MENPLFYRDCSKATGAEFEIPSPEGAAVSSLGRKPQEVERQPFSGAPEGRQRTALCRPSGATETGFPGKIPGAYAPGYSLPPLRGGNTRSRCDSLTKRTHFQTRGAKRSHGNL
jgi:hypothetical protein